MTSLRRSPVFIILLLAITACGPFAMQIFLPALPLIQRDFAVDVGTAQLVLTLSMISIAVSTLGFGPLSDRFGRRPVIVGGMVVFLLGSVMCVLAPTIWVLIAGRVVQASGAAAGMVLARSMVRDVYGHEDSPKALAYLTMAMLTAPMIAPALGGFLADMAGWRSIFTFILVLAVLIVAGVFWRLPETNPHAHAGSAIRGMTRLMRIPAFWGYALQSTLAISIFFAFVSGAPYLMSDVLHRPARDYGLFFIGVAGMFIVGNFISTRLLGRFGVDRLIRAGCIVSWFVVLGAGALWLALPLSPWLLFAPAFAVSFVQGFIITNGQAGAINVDPKAAGAASGLAGFLQMSISAAVAQAVGSLNDGTVWPMLIGMVGAATLALASLPLLYWRRRTTEGTAAS